MESQMNRDMPHSIELSRDKKGEYSWKIKLYFEDADDLTIAEKHKKHDEKLRAMFLVE